MRKFLRRLFSRKTMVRLPFIVAALLTLLIVAFYVERWRGQRAWNAYRAAAEQRGHKLWFADHIAPRIPDSENYAAIPLIEEAFKADAERRPPKPILPSTTVKDLKRPALIDPDLGTLNLTAWRDYFAATKAITKPTSDPARDLLVLLETGAPGLQQLRDAAARPGCRFPTEWEKGVATPVPHLAELLNAGRLFRISASTRLAAGDVAGAATEIDHLFRMHTALCGEPSMIAGLTRSAIFTHAIHAIREGFASGRWSDAELASFERSLSICNPLAELRFSLASERGFMNSELDRIAQMPPGDLWKLAELVSDPSGRNAVHPAWMALYPRGWMRLNMIRSNEYFDTLSAFFEPVAGRERDVIPPHATVDDWIRTHLGTSAWSRSYHLFLHLFLPAIDGVEAGFLAMHASQHQVRIACALERFRQARGALPEKLDALVPQFLQAIPKDICDGQPMRYRRDPGDSYVLWSVGWNRVDDGAKPEEKDKSPREQADWTWRISRK
jgi:hypothetical protein